MDAYVATMKKRPTPAPGSPTAFSIASQFTGPPFYVTLESAELRRHLLDEIAHPAGQKGGKVPAAKKAAKRQSKKPQKPA